MWRSADDNFRMWQQAFREYREQLATLRSRLNEDAYSFFDNADVHDGELLELRVVDGSRPPPLSEPRRPWDTVCNYPVKAEITVLDAFDQFVWTISYSSLRRTTIDYPGAEPLFYRTGEGFGDWGYHELTDAGDSFLRHEILFATGSILMFEFKHVAVRKAPARCPSAMDG
jgi:hypothetical protein